jgi:hypothetical protein
VYDRGADHAGEGQDDAIELEMLGIARLPETVARPLARAGDPVCHVAAAEFNLDAEAAERRLVKELAHRHTEMAGTVVHLSPEPQRAVQR